MSYLRTGIANKMYLGDQVYDVHIDQIYEEDVLMGYSILLMDLTDEEKQMKRIQSLVTAANEANQAKSVSSPACHTNCVLRSIPSWV